MMLLAPADNVAQDLTANPSDARLLANLLELGSGYDPVSDA